MKKGMIFSIERFSIHDGPGVRTSVFLKGCPLSCIWCHNPESQRMKPELKYVAEACINCRECGQVCENEVHLFPELHSVQRAEHQVQWERCKLCRSCIDICPSGALSQVGKAMDVEEVMRLVRKDKAYYKEEGGITLSGGEPLIQPEFCRLLLKQCKEEGISTCVETAGDVSKKALESIVEFVDLFLFDYKLSDPENMKKYTGGNLTRILENLKILCTMGKNIILRCPIIPGINDTEEHFRKIASLAVKLPLRGVELMPYHSFGNGKWRQVGKTCLLEDLDTVGKEQASEWNERLNSYIQ
ncbi:glycyl-radical enzyme activating protein [Robinsoniella peoriensis]|uniref:glycyl-radical enzyme activating protein n=1 Tax=Robinsoniella peoriensis TaxID=180332 RepID=UPI00085C5B57|nr:glycyl-radical enzyme activating protein [Robinsoniella peoriensis]